MFSLENELEKRLQIVADRDVLNERKIVKKAKKTAKKKDNVV